ncbi:MAG: hypothetical protein ACJZ9F_00675 [Rhodospirillaceae bacterium]
MRLIHTIAATFGLSLWLTMFFLYRPVSAQEIDLEPWDVGRYIQLDPIMVPFQTGRGIRYQVINVRLIMGEKSTARYACFVAPIVHEKILFYVWQRGLATADFLGDRKNQLAAEILEFVEEETDERYYKNLELAGEFDELDQDSEILSNYCKFRPGRN